VCLPALGDLPRTSSVVCNLAVFSVNSPYITLGVRVCMYVCMRGVSVCRCMLGLPFKYLRYLSFCPRFVCSFACCMYTCKHNRTCIPSRVNTIEHVYPQASSHNREWSAASELLYTIHPRGASKAGPETGERSVAPDNRPLGHPLLVPLFSDFFFSCSWVFGNKMPYQTHPRVF
jgi:hypothetical protein